MKLIKEELPKIAAVLNTNAENIEQLYDLVPQLSKKFCLLTSAELNVLLQKYLATTKI